VRGAPDIGVAEARAPATSIWETNTIEQSPASWSVSTGCPVNHRLGEQYDDPRISEYTQAPFGASGSGAAA